MGSSEGWCYRKILAVNVPYLCRVFCEGSWFGHLTEWRCSIREDLLGVSVTWLPGIAVMGPCLCTEQGCFFLWLPRSCFQVPGCVLTLFPAGHGCSTQGGPLR